MLALRTQGQKEVCSLECSCWGSLRGGKAGYYRCPWGVLLFFDL